MNSGIIGRFMVRWRGILLDVNPIYKPADWEYTKVDDSSPAILRELVAYLGEDAAIYAPQKNRSTAVDVFIYPDNPVCHELLDMMFEQVRNDES